MPFETLVDTETVARHLETPDWRLFDCRFDLMDPEAGRRAYGAGHVPGAVYVHLDEDLAGEKTPSTGRHPLPDLDSLGAKLCHWGVDRDCQLVAYDDGPGGIAARFWWLMRHLGLRHVAVMDGGFRAWREEGRPVTTEVPARRPTVFVPETRGDDMVDAAEFEKPPASRRYLLMDARGAERFRGETEPIDPVAGHVPGAVNRPFPDNLDENGRFHDPEALRRDFQQLLGGCAPGEVAHMCGSGVTACHNLLAMEYARLTGSKLYVGSWSEWITDTSRPVVNASKE
jgi:thiosulfate/3-mercaptopyruvate sulfurtransferase